MESMYCFHLQKNIFLLQFFTFQDFLNLKNKFRANQLLKIYTFVWDFALKTR
jgi:hypothetical protein